MLQDELSRANIKQFLLFSGLLITFYVRLYIAKADFWQYRDDSVIHLSHAKNLIQFGSIGLSPGDRTEAMSSPLNYLVGQLWFLIRPNSTYQSYLDCYTVIVLALLAGAYSVMARQLVDLQPTNMKNSTWYILIIPGIFTISSWTTFGWIVSGMENALGAILLILIASITIKNSQREPNTLLLQFLIFFAGIARIEFAALLLPFFLFAFVGLQKEPPSIKRISVLFAPIFLGWLVIHFTRFSYFGQLTPNTAQALGKNAGVVLIIFLLSQYILLLNVINSRPRIHKNIIRISYPILFVSAFSIFMTSTKNGNFHLPINLIALTLILLIAITARKISQANPLFRLLIISLVAPLDEYFLFGPARLSEFRIVAIFVPSILILFVFLTFKLTAPHNRINYKLVIILVIFLACIFTFLLTKSDPERNLCCKISPSEKLILSQADSFKLNYGFDDSVLPISASPDLGKVSFSKKLNVVDLGLIGDPLLSKLSIESPEDIGEYLARYATPDLIETHGHWSCRYSEFLNSAFFTENYEIVFQGRVSSEFDNLGWSSCPESGLYTIWARSLPKSEVDFLNTLIHAKPTSVPTFVRREVSTCNSYTDSEDRCEYVYRSVQRLWGELLKSNMSQEIVESLKKSPSYEFDKDRLLKKRNWAENAIHEFKLLAR